MGSYELESTIHDFPDGSCIIEPSCRTSRKDAGRWVCEGSGKAMNDDFPKGSLGVVHGAVRYVRGECCWLLINPPRVAVNQSSGNDGQHAELAIPLSVSYVQDWQYGVRVSVIQATEFRTRDKGWEQEEVVFDIPMSWAMGGGVIRAEDDAFTGEMSENSHQKASIRFCLPGVKESQRQRNIRTNNGRRPATRAYLAQVLAEEAKKLLEDVANAGEWLQCKGVRVTFQNLFLVKAKRMSKGTIQVTLGVMM
ncbi:hypothetical protein L226DRAFT_183360 [Lentinus tigrinus ALCF2SS1-7]|uniref:uncharacterized protein n=1 Tax=Lentinus tigrinus ALCF2SS1-7 TaxID=1328758 RepID=UPI00116629BB|nr:hypothetical protein L226DRAFT_183360 [Lentinus tigrinus ALCF2SS1-7]